VTDSGSSERRWPQLPSHKSYSVGSAEVVAVPVDDQSLVPNLRADIRGFLRESGIQIGESELLHVQEVCRDPEAALTNVLLVRKTCSLTGRPRISIVLLI
jgi:hypothetical protein